MKLGSCHIITTSTLLQPAKNPRSFASLSLQRRSIYGRERRCNTGKEQDSETGLYYYGARYLDSRTGRWLSGDPAVGDYIPSAPVNDEAREQNESLPGMGGVFNYANLHVYHYAGNNPVKYSDPDGDAINLAAAITLAVVGGATGAVIAAATGKSGREILATAAGGVVTGGMAGLTMGGSLAVQMGGAALAGTAGYMAENIVNGNPHTVTGTVSSAMDNVSSKMTGDLIGKAGNVISTSVNKSYVNYMRNTKTSSAAPLEVNYKDTLNKISTNETRIRDVTDIVAETVDVAKDYYTSRKDE